MSRRSLISVAALSLSAALLLASCRLDAADEPATADVEQASYYEPGFRDTQEAVEPTDGGTLTVADWSEPPGLSPLVASPTGYTAGSPFVAVYDQLIRWDARSQTYEPRLATDVEPNDDFTEWTITLREGAKFSDGTPVDADAVVGSMNYFVKNGGRDMAVVGPLWGGVKKVDDLTVKVSLTDSWSTFIEALGKAVGFIMAPAAIEGGPENFKPIGAGAFTVESHRPQEELLLKANPNHWDGGPHLDQLRFVWLGGDQTAYEALQAGSVDLAVVRDASLVHQAQDADLPGYVDVESGGNVIVINGADGRPGANPKVRQAIAHAVDPEAIFERVSDGLGLPTQHLFSSVSQWYNPDAAVPEIDPEQAAELVEEAKAEGFDGRVVLTSNQDPFSREMGLAIAGQLEAAGFTVEQDHVPNPGAFINKVYFERNYDFARGGLALNDGDPYWRLFTFLHSASPGNIVNNNDAELDALIEELRTKQGDDRAETLNKIEARYLAQHPMVTMSANASMFVWDTNVYGVTATNDSMMAFDEAWITE